MDILLIFVEFTVAGFALIAGIFLYMRRRGGGTSAEQSLDADEQAALRRALERE